ncbi:ChrR family anti-sigma-E factor [Vibrio bivalvicida]|uniref:Transcriptional regulator n=1 Tax=Vibrio bivalvicida TaxID=1276888 RepID=A0A177Y480_9VIBR|nr:ChrR family anti-sigma-E factor [Vibrio bivalvicida]OAJ95386.1 transcriptional regulator [Vibrio bivalvicida]
MSYHPQTSMLQAYVQGMLDDVSAFTIATHIESCPKCRQMVQHFEAQCGEELFNESIDSTQGLDSMFEQIVSLEQNCEPLRPPRLPTFIEVNGKNFRLPLSLTRFRDRISEWKNYGGKVYSASIDISEQARVNLMYIAEDVTIPQHTHKGLESTLVLHGGFSDEEGHYQVGDYLLKDGSVKHSPFTRQGEDCLCLTVLTEPMLFTQGVARVFNLFGKGMYP